MSRVIDGIEKAKQRYADGYLSVEDLEDEVEFWLEVEQCRYCSCYEGSTLCSAHYTKLLG